MSSSSGIVLLLVPNTPATNIVSTSYYTSTATSSGEFSINKNSLGRSLSLKCNEIHMLSP